MRRRAQQGPSLFDEVGPALTGEQEAHLLSRPPDPAVTHVAGPVLDYATDPPSPVVGVPPLAGVHAALASLPPAQPRRAWRGEPGFLFHMSPAERAAADVPLPERSRWTFEGREVEVRGTSPLMVWFTVPGAPQTSQATRHRHEFLKKAVRL